MVTSTGWQWNLVDANDWLDPDPFAYYLAARWEQTSRRKLLDLGCGKGRHAIMFAKQGFCVDACDVSESGIALVDRAVQELQIPIVTRVSDMASLPYENGYFDCLIAFHVIYHADREGLEQVISEIYRVLAPGGEAFLTFISFENPAYRDPASKRLDERTLVKQEGIEAGIMHYFVDVPEVRRLLADFTILLLDHLGQIREDGESWHYYVLARKD